MKALITGGGGFIGHHLARRLLDDGADVRVLDNFATGRRERLLGLPVEIVEGDLRSYERVHTAVRGVDLVFHLGALPSVPRSVQDPLSSDAVNVEGTLNVLLASRDEQVGRLVFASSSSVYGANPSLPKTEAHQPLPLSPYAVSKLAGEQYCRAFFAVYGLPTVALRLFNVFGPGQNPHSEYAAVVPRFIADMSRGRQPTVYGDGLQTRDFTYVADVVDAFVRASQTDEAVGEFFNIAGGRQTSIRELIDHLNQALDTQLAPILMPPRDGEVRDSVGDGGKAARVLGWVPRWQLGDALRACVEAWREAQTEPQPAG